MHYCSRITVHAWLAARFGVVFIKLPSEFVRKRFILDFRLTCQRTCLSDWCSDYEITGYNCVVFFWLTRKNAAGIPVVFQGILTKSGEKTHHKWSQLFRNRFTGLINTASNVSAHQATMNSNGRTVGHPSSRCLTIIRTGVPSRPKTDRIWFSKYRKYEKWKSFASLQKQTKVGGRIPVWVM